MMQPETCSLPIDTIICGDALAELRTLPAECVQTVITSPPYYGLRDYGTPGQIGLEETPAAYVARLVEVFREVKRVLRRDGVLWLNLGDSYSGAGDRSAKRSSGNHPRGCACASCTLSKPKMPKVSGLSGKDMLGMPWRVAFALQADGWILRSDCIWHKPNCMPESVRDRPTKSHEYLFLFAKSERYYYDGEAINEPATAAGQSRSIGPKTLSRGQAIGRGVKPSGNGAKDFMIVPTLRNKRTVWTIATQPCKEAHFAVMPPALVEPCILAGSRPGDVVLDPFMGAGTVGVVAAQHGRHYLGIELNAAYIALAEQRIAAANKPKPAKVIPLAARRRKHTLPANVEQLALFA